MKRIIAGILYSVQNDVESMLSSGMKNHEEDLVFF